MTPQDYDDINVLKHAARDILRELGRLLKDSSIDDLESEELVEKGRAITRIGEIISEILENGKHLPYGEEEK